MSSSKIKQLSKKATTIKDNTNKMRGAMDKLV